MIDIYRKKTDIIEIVQEFFEDTNEVMKMPEENYFLIHGRKHQN